MNQLRLSTRLLLGASATLLLFLAASIGVLYQAQSRLAIREMDRVLENEVFALSSLVDVKEEGRLDFEFSPLILSRYQKTNSRQFFRFFPETGSPLLRESLGAPSISCDLGHQLLSTQIGKRTYRVLSIRFQPEIDEDVKNPANISRPSLCLVVGMDEAPFTQIVSRTLLASLPLWIAIFACALLAFFILIQKLTQDLRQLRKALAVADFGGTHAFPSLPKPKTPEVKAVVSVLEGLHQQAAETYAEMWLFLGRAAHQLKTPVAGLSATLEVLLRKERSKEELLAALKDIELGTRQLSTLSHKLISSSRIGYASTEPETLELGPFFSNLAELFKTAAEARRIRIELSGDARLPIHANPDLLNELFGNLLDNAILYSSEGSLISIRWEKTNEALKITLRDQGQGIPPQVQERLFEPFVRGDESRVSGSGLGLSIAKRAAHLSKGTLELESSSAQGSCFSVVFKSAASR